MSSMYAHTPRKNKNQKMVNMVYDELVLLKHIQKNTHPHIATVKRVDITNDGMTATYTTSNNGTLDKMIQIYQQQDTKIQEHLIMNYFTQIIDGLTFLHLHGYIHRNITPDSIIIGTYGTLSIADFEFSSSKSISSLHLQHLTVFSAPELYQKEKHTQNVDIWSVGCIIWKMARLVDPWTNKSEQQVHKAKILQRIQQCKIHGIEEYADVKYFVQWLVRHQDRPSCSQIANFYKQVSYNSTESNSTMSSSSNSFTDTYKNYSSSIEQSTILDAEYTDREIAATIYIQQMVRFMKSTSTTNTYQL